MLTTALNFMIDFTWQLESNWLSLNEWILFRSVVVRSANKWIQLTIYDHPRDVWIFVIHLVRVFFLEISIQSLRRSILMAHPTRERFKELLTTFQTNALDLQKTFHPIGVRRMTTNSKRNLGHVFANVDTNILICLIRVFEKWETL